MERKRQSALVFVLKGLIPYSRENLTLAYKPGQFFRELEKASNYKQKTLRSAYYRGKKQDLIRGSIHHPRLTDRGEMIVRPFVPAKLTGQVHLMVIFDIPEDRSFVRHKLRRQLKQWHFKQIQKSVWATDMDYREMLVDLIAELRAGEYVEIYEGVKLFP